ncbi:MAG TPA: asparagine synthase (glutamine-hydrolyzing) [Candidatus Kapabacteria bacterium]|nr:asparagine synthase (glutamine-hydrolyzing) [Candidatus Kapabacteria bacterium]
MCGIAGIIATNGAPIGEEDVSRLHRAAEAMRHRGPDDDGLFVTASGMAAFAHRRLSIIDPTPEAHQPMLGSGGNVLVFNGEIYNYRELASAYKLCVPPSDTAVLLALLELRGISILPELRGFFTFAWWNDARRELLIARDAIGKKPLYYGTFGGRFVFASELRALVSSGLAPFELSPEGLAGYLRYYSVPHPLSMVRGVKSLGPGSILRLRDGNESIERWYRLPKHHATNIGYEDAVRETRRILERSVRDRLVSDVPVGAFLSGGLDSNAITGLAMREVSSPIETFSIGFSSRDVESETEWARIGANAFGTIHHERNITDSDVAELLPDFFRSMDSPTGDGLNTLLVAKTAREFSPNLKVVLSGVGGDEAFLGYKKYRWLARRAAVLRIIWSLPKTFRRGLAAPLAGARHSRGRAGVRAALMPEQVRWLFSEEEILALTASVPLDGVDSVDGVDGDVFLSVLRSDIEYYLPDMLLRDLDGMTMSQSLEARAPLLDNSLMEFTWQLPLAMKARGANKQLLADAVKDIVPESLLKKPKTGFELPMKEWLLRGALRSQLDILTSQNLKLVEDGVLTVQGVRRVHKEFLQGRSHYLKPWTIIALEQWYQSMKKLPTSGLTIPRHSAEAV